MMDIRLMGWDMQIKERPILFSGEMVRAILKGRKTQTRRSIKGEWPWLKDPKKFYLQKPEDRAHLSEPAVINGDEWKRSNSFWWYESEYPEEGGIEFICPYGKPGDRLWVRETWAHCYSHNETMYRADGANKIKSHSGVKWKPSIHMPRKASRITLEILNVSVERLDDISEDEAQQEGVLLSVQTEAVNHFAPHLPPLIWRHYEDQGAYCETARESFKTLWQSINGPGTWAANPWVWVIEFKVVRA